MRRLPGFSLIETLVAFAIVAGAFVLVVSEMPFISGRASFGVEAALANDFAHSRFGEIGRLSPADPGNSFGTVEGKWQWRQTIQLAGVGASSDPAVKVTIEVFDLSGRTRLAVVEGYR